MTIVAITAAAAFCAVLAIPPALAVLVRAEAARAAPRPVTVRVRSRRR